MLVHRNDGDRCDRQIRSEFIAELQILSGATVDGGARVQDSGCRREDESRGGPPADMTSADPESTRQSATCRHDGAGTSLRTLRLELQGCGSTPNPIAWRSESGPQGSDSSRVPLTAMQVGGHADWCRLTSPITVGGATGAAPEATGDRSSRQAGPMRRARMACGRGTTGAT